MFQEKGSKKHSTIKENIRSGVAKVQIRVEVQILGWKLNVRHFHTASIPIPQCFTTEETGDGARIKN